MDKEWEVGEVQKLLEVGREGKERVREDERGSSGVKAGAGRRGNHVIMT